MKRFFPKNTNRKIYSGLLNVNKFILSFLVLIICGYVYSQNNTTTGNDNNHTDNQQAVSKYQSLIDAGSEADQKEILTLPLSYLPRPLKLNLKILWVMTKEGIHT